MTERVILMNAGNEHSVPEVVPQENASDNDDSDSESDNAHLMRETLRFPASYQRNVQMWMNIHMAVNTVYFLAFLLFIWNLRTYANMIIFGYPRLDLKPGPLINDRIDPSSYILVLSLLNFFIILIALWMLYPLTESWRRKLHLYTNAAMLFFNLGMLIVLLVYWLFLCNRGLLGFALCNDVPETYCRVYNTSFPGRCALALTSLPALSASSLQTPLAFWILLGCVAVFIVCNATMWITNTFVDSSASKYIEMAAIKQPYSKRR